MVGYAGVQGSDVSEEAERAVEYFDADAESLVGVASLLFETDAVLADSLESRLGGGAGDVSIGEEVDDSFLLDSEFLELSSDSLVELPDGGLLVIDGRDEVLLDPVGGSDIDLDGVHVAFDVFLDHGHREVGHVAVAVLASAAEVVRVGAAFALGFGVDEAAAPSGAVAAVAEQEAAFEVVEVDAVSGSPGSERHDLLDAVEELLADERLVPPWEVLAFEYDNPCVVGVGEHAVKLGDGYRPRCRASPCLFGR